MHIAGMTIGGVPPFTEPVEFEFDEHVNVFIGPNGVGKSTVTRALGRQPIRMGRYVGKANRDVMQFAVRVMDHSQEREVPLSTARRQHPFVILPAIRVNLPLESDQVQMKDLSERYDAEEGLDSLLEDSDWIFDGRIVAQAFALINEQSSAGEFSLEDSRQRLYLRDVSYQCTQSICPDVFVGDSPFDYESGIIKVRPATPWWGRIAWLDREIPEYTPAKYFGMGVRIKDENAPAGARNLFVGSLSSGTQGTLLWIWYLALRLAHFYEFKQGWEKQQAVLLIDEIENHLHPTWQRRVIPALKRYFPGLQIFATTHSPFVVAGLEKGQVHMLKRDADGVVRVSTNEHDIIGWTTDEILRTFMGVDEPTDQLTIDRRERLTALREKDSLTDEEATEMEELRDKINEDFMSSSTPLDAQRERYGDMMLEFLRSRQSELSQDGD